MSKALGLPPVRPLTLAAVNPAFDRVTEFIALHNDNLPLWVHLSDMSNENGRFLYC